jgi:predicted amidohydrolase
VILSIVLAQMPVTFSLDENAERMLAVLAAAEAGDIVVTPEGSLTGYLVNGASDLESLRAHPAGGVTTAIERLHEEATRRSAVLWLGVCRRDGDGWVNEAVGLMPGGTQVAYRKVNLSTAEREHGFVAGDSIPVYAEPSSGIGYGVQMCREVRYPEQWRTLAERGASAVLHLNHGLGETDGFATWRSMLISRAAENQRFVVSVNAASPAQHCPSIAIGPDGVVLTELEAGEERASRVLLDVARVSDRYVDQRRRDIGF